MGLRFDCGVISIDMQLYVRALRAVVGSGSPTKRQNGKYQIPYLRYNTSGAEMIAACRVAH